MSELAARLALGVVAVVGSGLSISARYPDALGLNALLWEAVDADLGARKQLADCLDLQDAPGKNLIGDRAEALDLAWRTIETSSNCRARFQSEFANLDATRSAQPSLSHEALARLVHANVVECVVSLNWDSALERAYRRLYGTRLPAGVLYKPHGDAATPIEPWILPHEAGRVHDDLLGRVSQLVAEHPRTLLIVGYSESDHAVVEQLIAPLDERWPVVRVGPLVTGSDDVVGNADDVLDALAAPWAERESESPWHVVASWGTRGIDAALEGGRLQPADVDACPRLPEADRLSESLRRDHAVVLNGLSGSGKSITAYQVLHDLCRDGWEVLRLRDGCRTAGKDVWLTGLRPFPRRKVLFIDDAQDLSPDAVRELAEVATGDRLVLVVGVDHVAGGVTTLTMNEASAVGALERYVRENRDEFCRRVHELDSRVGEGFGDDRFDDRVATAARERTPWQFFFVLTGGWSRTVDRLNEVRVAERADLAGLALAVAQIAGVDGSVTVSDLVPYAVVLGRDEEWLRRSLAVLSDERLAVETEGAWRCAHLRAARALVRWALHPPVWPMPAPRARVVVGPIASAAGDVAKSDRAGEGVRARRRRTPYRFPEAVIEEHRKTLALLIDTALDQPSTSMRGAAWLITDHNHEALWVLRKQGIRSEERDRDLVTRALETQPGPDVAMAAQLIVQLSWPNNRQVLDETWSGIDKVVQWVREVTPESGWAVADLVNLLSNDDRDRLASHLATVSPDRVAGLIDAGGWAHIYSTMRAVDRISHGGGLPLTRDVGAALDEGVLVDMLSRAPDLRSIDALLSPLAYVEPDLGLRLFDGVAIAAAGMFSRDPLGVHDDIFDTTAFLLGFAPSFLRHKEPSATQREVARSFASAIDKDALAAAMSCPNGDQRWLNFPQFISFFEEADSEGFVDVVARLNFDRLGQELESQLPRPGPHVLFVLMQAAATRSEDVFAVLEAHADRFEDLHVFLAWTHPRLAVRLLRRGLPLDLRLASQDYENAAELLERLAAEDEAVAAEVAEANAVGFASGLAVNHSARFEGIADWIKVCERVSPGTVDRVLGNLPAATISNWRQYLKDESARSRVLTLVSRVSKNDGTPASVAALELLQSSRETGTG